MCLSVITKQFKPNNKTVKGYKVIRMNISSPKFTTSERYFPIEMDRWLKAKSPLVPLRDGREKIYPWGFHIWATRRAAEQWAKYSICVKIVPVIGRNVQVVGKQDNYKVYVCKHLFIPTSK